MAVEKPAREIPYCTIFLVVGALTCHTFVLLGNLATSRMLSGLGDSTKGWANIGVSLSDALIRELDPAMNNVSDALTQTIGTITDVQDNIDNAISVAGSLTDTALANFTEGNVSIPQFKARLNATLYAVTDRLFARVQQLINKFVDLIKPALKQIGEWLVSFGEKIRTALEQFGTTIDRVQKLLDQLLSQVTSTVGQNEDVMVYETYTLFDADQDSLVTVADIQSVGTLYSIPSLTGDLAGDLLEKYDDNNDGALTEQEYTLLSRDQTTPNIMGLVLRGFASKLLVIAGNLGAATMRDEVSLAVVNYFDLMCVKNQTKLSWVSHTLTNGSVPIQFTADVLKNLAMNVDNPDQLTVADTGALVIEEMLRLNETTVLRAIKLLINPAFWDSEGFKPADQPKTVERVLGWVVNTTTGPEFLRQSFGSNIIGNSEVDSNLPKAAAAVVKRRSDQYVATQNTTNGGGITSSSSTAQQLNDLLLGGAGARGAEDPEAGYTQKAGQAALPPTLLFAARLSSNATATSNTYLQYSMDYSGESSGATESFANQVNGMIKKMTNFIDIMETYTTDKGIARILNEAGNFTSGATQDITMVLENQVDKFFNELQCKQSNTTCVSAQQPDFPLQLSGAFTFVTGILYEIKSVIPTVVDDLKYARTEVSAVSEKIHSVMDILGGTAPPIFTSISQIYKAAWIAYFILFGLLTTAVLFYGFWGSGWCGGPNADVEHYYEPPRTITDRCIACCKCCTSCLRGCHDSHICFWSVLILLEIIGLLIFVIAIVICILAGLQAFMSAGCSQIYILGDDTICTTAITVIKSFVKTFWSGLSVPEAAGMPISEICGRENLLTCQLIKKQLGTALLLEIIGSFLASILSFQMVINSASMHERARWRKMFDAANKQNI